MKNVIRKVSRISSTTRGRGEGDLFEHRRCRRAPPRAASLASGQLEQLVVERATPRRNCPAVALKCWPMRSTIAGTWSNMPDRRAEYRGQREHDDREERQQRDERGRACWAARACASRSASGDSTIVSTIAVTTGRNTTEPIDSTNGRARNRPSAEQQHERGDQPQFLRGEGQRAALRRRRTGGRSTSVACRRSSARQCLSAGRLPGPDHAALRRQSSRDQRVATA